MEVQPQLVLLQKTLLYIEGLGRQLYPQLDLWQTAKPFLENWVKEQMGVKAVFTKVKENLPFWNEKLPELPDLFYDYLKAGKESHFQQSQLIEKITQQQHANNQGLIFGILAAGLIISSALLMNQNNTVLASISAGAAALCFVLSFNK
jgi:ubiquinone biosynthesis protein